MWFKHNLHIVKLRSKGLAAIAVLKPIEAHYTLAWCGVTQSCFLNFKLIKIIYNIPSYIYLRTFRSMLSSFVRCSNFLNIYPYFG